MQCPACQQTSSAIQPLLLFSCTSCSRTSCQSCKCCSNAFPHPANDIVRSVTAITRAANAPQFHSANASPTTTAPCYTLLRVNPPKPCPQSSTKPSFPLNLRVRPPLPLPLPTNLSLSPIAQRRPVRRPTKRAIPASDHPAFGPHPSVPTSSHVSRPPHLPPTSSKNPSSPSFRPVSVPRRNARPKNSNRSNQQHFLTPPSPSVQPVKQIPRTTRPKSAARQVHQTLYPPLQPMPTQLVNDGTGNPHESSADHVQAHNQVQKHRPRQPVPAVASQSLTNKYSPTKTGRKRRPAVGAFQKSSESSRQPALDCDHAVPISHKQTEGRLENAESEVDSIADNCLIMRKRPRRSTPLNTLKRDNPKTRSSDEWKAKGPALSNDDDQSQPDKANGKPLCAQTQNSDVPSSPKQARHAAQDFEKPNVEINRKSNDLFNPVRPDHFQDNEGFSVTDRIFTRERKLNHKSYSRRRKIVKTPDNGSFGSHETVPPTASTKTANGPEKTLFASAPPSPSRSTPTTSPRNQTSNEILHPRTGLSQRPSQTRSAKTRSGSSDDIPRGRNHITTQRSEDAADDFAQTHKNDFVKMYDESNNSVIPNGLAPKKQSSLDPEIAQHTRHPDSAVLSSSMDTEEPLNRQNSLKEDDFQDPSQLRLERFFDIPRPESMSNLENGGLEPSPNCPRSTSFDIGVSSVREGSLDFECNANVASVSSPVESSPAFGSSAFFAATADAIGISSSGKKHLRADRTSSSPVVPDIERNLVESFNGQIGTEMRSTKKSRRLCVAGLQLLDLSQTPQSPCNGNNGVQGESMIEQRRLFEDVEGAGSDEFVSATCSPERATSDFLQRQEPLDFGPAASAHDAASYRNNEEDKGNMGENLVEVVKEGEIGYGNISVIDQDAEEMSSDNDGIFGNMVLCIVDHEVDSKVVNRVLDLVERMGGEYVFNFDSHTPDCVVTRVGAGKQVRWDSSPILRIARAKRIPVVDFDWVAQSYWNGYWMNISDFASAVGGLPGSSSLGEFSS